jgi:molybdopterin-containing oxidoreductase family iron-sulfur binding subunit
MKTIPPPCPEPEGAVRYWRGLEELENTPEFREALEREFPAGASELTDPTTRRAFMKLMGASMALAGIGSSGCRRPEHKILPFGRQPEDYIHGVPQFFATAMPTRTGAVPLVAVQHDGRPTKVEGNARHPESNGGTDIFAQASILNLYDPDRSKSFLRGGAIASREAAMDFLAALGQQAASRQGAGLAVLAGSSTSPSRLRLREVLRQKLPQAQWFTYESVDFDAHRQGASLATGMAVAPYYRMAEAQVVVSLDCDFLGAEEDSPRYNRDFARGRKAAAASDSLNRLYVAEARLSVTGCNADHRLRLPVSQVLPLAAALAAQVLPAGEIRTACEAIGQPAGVDPSWVRECAADLVARRGAALVVAGYQQPIAVHAIAHALNAALGAIGRTIEFRESTVVPGGTLSELAAALNAGQVETLIILEGNPVYDAPADLNWAETQRKARGIVRLGAYADETSGLSDWHLPAAHYLEAWGDARTSDGTLVAVQPLIRPLFGGLSEIEVLARLLGEPETQGYQIVRATFRALTDETGEDAWERYLHEGFLAESARPAVEAAIDGQGVVRAISSARPLQAPTRDSLEIIYYRGSLDDGRFANNGWLQEFPDPITKITWDNAALISRKTAQDLNLRNSEVVRLQAQGRSLRVPLWITPGLADGTIALALGYGRTEPGRVACFEGKPVGFNAGALRTAEGFWVTPGARVSGTGDRWSFATTQNHWAMNGRPIVREANLEQFRSNPAFARGFGLMAHAEHIPLDAEGQPVELYKTPFEEQPEIQVSKVNQWAMSIDLSACTGCGACVVACQSENNVPIVGKDQVLRGREMHWLRIDRYFTGYRAPTHDKLISDEEQWRETWIDDPQVVNQPMLCQHCEKAPCESVCPVNATSHDTEGLNLMTYNRCVGTRYCSNNCPWKVRRFNYFDFNKRPINYGNVEGMSGLLYKGPLARRKSDEVQLAAMVNNPQVTVRMRGVMEKCTFCIQRIQLAKIARKVEAGKSGDVQVRDADGLQTACQQACPAEAIMFGNQLEPESRVNQWKRNPRDYTVLGFLDTRPRLTYLAKLRNPNPAMPDYRQVPDSVTEYKILNHSDPFAAPAHDAAQAGDEPGYDASGGPEARPREGGH